MNQTAVGWIALAIAVFVFLDLLFVELRRMVREGGRIVTRLIAYADLPVADGLARAADDAERLGLAATALSELIERARVALETIRYPRGRPTYRPFVPNGSDASNGSSED